VEKINPNLPESRSKKKLRLSLLEERKRKKGEGNVVARKEQKLESEAMVYPCAMRKGTFRCAAKGEKGGGASASEV